MSREWCVVIRPHDDVASDQRQLIELALAMREPPFDMEAEGSDFLVFGNAGRSIKQLKKAVLHSLAASGVADSVITPLWVGRLDPSGGGYDFPDWIGEPTTPPSPTLIVEPQEIHWIVSVAPKSFTGWRALREDLVRRGRLIVGENDHAIEVGARDQADADELIGRLEADQLIRVGHARSIGRLRRWRIRQQLLGGYVGPVDPTQPTLFGPPY